MTSTATDGNGRERGAALHATVEELWAVDVMEPLSEFLRIPDLSPAFDAEWEAHGHIAAAVDLITDWCRARPILGLTVRVLEIEGRTPVVVCEIPATPGAEDAGTVLLYGHLDKQPEMTGWRDGLSAWAPVLDGERLYGRGGADDGYSVFAALTAITAVREHGGAHARCVVLIEASEESGSPDLPAHLAEIDDVLGTPSLVVCLDSGAASYDRLWVTTSLRGLVSGRLRVQVLTEGVHSGAAGGVVPSAFAIVRELLDRVQDPRTGDVLVPEMHVDIPPARVAEARTTGAELGADVASGFPFAGSTRPLTDDPAEQLLATTWRPALEVIGLDGLPATADAGNVARPELTVSLSFRIPPRCDPAAAGDALRKVLEADPPWDASVSFELEPLAAGWDAPPEAPWLTRALDAGSVAGFGLDARHFGEGGSIPFMAMLGEQFPDAQFVVTGVLGPASNAHGPNEFLDLPTARGVTTAVAVVLEAHASR
ncbi:MAG: peptidase family protein [Actinomycetia bacterium]|nr:peptidase family protein [Actinomycetes bacterium]